MIFHVVEEEKFLNRTIEIFENILPGQNKYLIGVNPKKRTPKDYLPNNLEYVLYEYTGTNSYLKTFIECQEKARLVIFHNLYKEYKLQLGEHIRKDRKIGWMFWGAELYGLNTKINNLLPLTNRYYTKSLSPKTYIRKKVLSRFKRRYHWRLFKNILEHKVDYILTNIEDDVDLLGTFAKHNSKTIWYTYFNQEDSGITQDNKAIKEHVLVGNSSSVTNNHFDTFDLLRIKELGDRKIYVPLSYGDEHYKILVKEEAEASFKNASPIIDFLSLNEYSKILQSCSVMIMNHKRQQAFNTIMLALFVGCKVFLREENTIYSYLKREGYIIHSIQQEFANAEALNPLRPEQQQHNKALIVKQYSKKVIDGRIKEQILEILNE